MQSKVFRSAVGSPPVDLYCGIVQALDSMIHRAEPAFFANSHVFNPKSNPMPTASGEVFPSNLADLYQKSRKPSSALDNRVESRVEGTIPRKWLWAGVSVQPDVQPDGLPAAHELSSTYRDLAVLRGSCKLL